MLNNIRIGTFLLFITCSFIFSSCKNESTTSESLAKTENKENIELKKILFVVTSHDEKGSTGEKTGYYLGEVSHPWEVLHSAGYEIDFVNPKGGEAPIDAFVYE